MVIGNQYPSQNSHLDTQLTDSADVKEALPDPSTKVQKA
jgi:hypothetical protein